MLRCPLSGQVWLPNTCIVHRKQEIEKGMYRRRENSLSCVVKNSTGGCTGLFCSTSDYQRAPNPPELAQPRLSRVKARSSPARGTNLGVFVPIWPVMRMLG